MPRRRTRTCKSYHCYQFAIKRIEHTRYEYFRSLCKLFRLCHVLELDGLGNGWRRRWMVLRVLYAIASLRLISYNTPIPIHIWSNQSNDGLPMFVQRISIYCSYIDTSLLSAIAFVVTQTYTDAYASPLCLRSVHCNISQWNHIHLNGIMGPAQTREKERFFLWSMNETNERATI